MNIKKIFFIGIFLLALVSISAVSAEDNALLCDSVSQNIDDGSDGLIIEDSQAISDLEVSLSQSSSYGNDAIKSTSQDDWNSDFLQSTESEISKNQTGNNFTIEFYDDYHEYGETNIFGFLMPKDIQNNVSVEIDGKSYAYEIYDINNLEQWVWGGDAQTQMGYMVKFFDLSPGDHEVIISYPGDSIYAESSLVKNISVHGVDDYKMLSKLTAANLNAYYKANKSFTASLKDENGNPIKDAEIKILLNGKNETRKTDDNGQVRIGTNKLIPKSYDISLAYEGNDYYSNSSVKAKITIKKLVSKISAPKKTFKKSLKTKKYTITLKANSKALKNAKVYLKIKGKTYTAKTNSYGKATFKITKLSKKGTFKATVKYAGSKYCSAKTVTAKIICK